MIIVVGIKSCDTCRKALAWLTAQNVAHSFHDLRADGLDTGRLSGWVKAGGWEAVLNRRSTTWRGLADAQKSDLTAEKAEALMIANPTLIKRPVIEAGNTIHIGFTDAVKAALVP
ncbi:MAG: arsenate reductase [Rhodospirillaceae bacterium]|jgi:arsenate reductase (glutaredoxin)|nr:arsenate reductase [Rhodospirillaceae bacterium]MBT5564304.1 arsenate reductase [Rhodospirillaceae bacterium]MBT6088866.1 arsenate reductase [Rhodospirillaceae bacterium]